MGHYVVLEFSHHVSYEGLHKGVYSKMSIKEKMLENEKNVWKSLHYSVYLVKICIQIQSGFLVAKQL